MYCSRVLFKGVRTYETINLVLDIEVLLGGYNDLQ